MSSWKDIINNNRIEECINKINQSDLSLQYNIEKGRTPLIFATIKKKIDIIKCLLQSGDDINRTDDNGYTALHHSVFLNQLEIAKLLFTFNANANLRDIAGLCPISFASSEEMVKLLIFKGADTSGYLVDRKSWQRSKILISKNYAAMVKLSKDFKDVVPALNAINGISSNPYRCDDIPWAKYISESNIGMILSTLTQHPNVINHFFYILGSKHNIEWHTPLSFACFNNKTAIIDILLEHHANVNLLNSYRTSLLMLSISKSISITIINKLIKNGANINHQNNDGDSALFCAIKRDSLDVVLLLMQHHVDSSLVLSTGDHVLMICIQRNKIKIFSKILTLLDPKFDLINKTNNNQQTPLTVAVILGNLEAAQLLLLSNCDLHLTDKNGHSALDYAVINNSIQLAKLLVTDKVVLNTKITDQSEDLVNLLISHKCQFKLDFEKISICNIYKYSKGMDLNVVGEAIRCKRRDILDFMISKKTRITMAMLYVAIKEVGDIAVIELLMKQMSVNKEEIKELINLTNSPAILSFLGTYLYDNQSITTVDLTIENKQPIFINTALEDTFDKYFALKNEINEIRLQLQSVSTVLSGKDAEIENIKKLMAKLKETATKQGSLLEELPDGTPTTLVGQRTAILEIIKQFNKSVEGLICPVCTVNIKNHASECGHLYCKECLTHCKNTTRACYHCTKVIGTIRQIYD